MLAKSTPLLTDLVTNPTEIGTRTVSVEMTAGREGDKNADLNLDDIIQRILEIESESIRQILIIQQRILSIRLLKN